MKRTTLIWLLVGVFVLGGSWWWFQTHSTVITPEGPGLSNTISLGTSNASDAHPYLTASNGMTLYIFDKDSVGTTTCYGQCAEKWPPYVVAPNVDVTAPNGALGKVDAIVRADGGRQLTYNGYPLYFFVSDKAAGDMLGDNVNNIWHVVTP